MSGSKSWLKITQAGGLTYLGTRDQLRGGQGALGGGSDHPVLEHGVLGDLGHVLGLQYQHGRSVGHRLGQVHQDVLEIGPSRSGDVSANISNSHLKKKKKPAGETNVVQLLREVNSRISGELQS